MTIDYIILFLFFVVSLVAVFLARKTVLDYKKIEEDRKDLRQDAAKQNQMILKQMQNQHEIDMMRIEAAAQNGGADMMTLLQTVLPILLNNKNDNIQMSESEPTPTPTLKSETEAEDGESETDVKENDSEKTGQFTSNSPPEPGKSVSDSAPDAENRPKTLMRQWVDSPDSDRFFLKYKHLMK